MCWTSRKKGPSGFSAESTAEEVTEGIDGSGLTAIITGATRGIGVETARVLALRGVHVIMAVRNTVAATTVREDIIKEIPAAKIDVMELDLSYLESVRNFTSKFNSSGLPLNILINNAGTKGPFKLSKDNIELTFATNHLGHFLLTSLLLETMKRTSETSGKEGRIMNVSSLGHNSILCRGVRFDKLDINRPMFLHDQTAYTISKLANILHANELARQLKEEGANITANSLHPGVVQTEMLNENHWITKIYKATIVRFSIRNVQQGAATTCYVALHPQVKGISGQYFADCNLSKASSQATDIALAKELWDLSINLVNETQLPN